MTAEAWRPGGNFAICCFAQARFSSLNAKLAGCSSFGARRRTDMGGTDSLAGAGGGARIQVVNTVLPERACGCEHVIADVSRHLDAVENGKFGDGFEAVAAWIVDDQFQRGLLEDIARHRVAAIVAMLLAQNCGIALQQPGAALDSFDLD